MSLTRFYVEIQLAAGTNPDNKLFSADTLVSVFTVGGEKIMLNEFPWQIMNPYTDFSGNPAYPKARAGHIYVAVQAGEIGQVGGTPGTGKFVGEKDILICLEKNDGGDETTVGSKWVVIGSNGTGGSTSRSLSQVDQTPDIAGMTYGVISGAVDGANDTFVVSKKNYTPGTLVVAYRGQVMFQKMQFEESNAAIGEFKFLFIPVASSPILAMYAYKDSRLGSFDDSFDDSFD